MNVLLHGLASWLAYRLARELGASVSAATAGAFFFALHPASAECVSWVSGRKDLLACCFGIATLLTYTPGTTRARTLSVLSFAAGLLCKPSIASLILLLPSLRAEERAASLALRTGQWLRQLAPYALVLLPITWLGIAGQRAVGASQTSYFPLSWLHGVWYSFGHHASLVLFMEEPTAKYVPAPWPPAFPAKADAAAVTLLAIIALCLWRFRGERAHLAQFGASFAGLAFLPVSGVLVPISRYLADAYVYLPLVGLGLCLAAALDQITASFPERVVVTRTAPYLLAFVLSPFFLRSSARFESDVSLWAHAYGRFRHPRVCRQLANAVYKQQGPEDGLTATDHCIARFGRSLYARNRSIMLAELGRHEEARAWLSIAAREGSAAPTE